MTHSTITIFAPHVEFSGISKVMTTLATEIACLGHPVHLIRAHREWPTMRGDSNGVSVVELPGTRFASIVSSPRSFRLKMSLLALVTVPPMIAYLRRWRPKAVILGLLSVPGLWAIKLAGTGTKAVISAQGMPNPRRLHHPLIQRYSYLRADAIVADCEAIGDALSRVSGIPRSRITAVQNPVLDGSEVAKMREPVTHPWFLDGGPPILLGVGRFLPQKDFPTLVRAFARVRARRPARLVILGDGDERSRIEKLVGQLGLEDGVSLPGFVDNPFKYMAAADVFVLSSIFEGPGHVVIEALASGVPIVATDCPAGPRETLMDGRLGSLVPVGDPDAMADAILDTIENREAAHQRTREGLKHLDRFSSRAVAREYLRIIENL